MLLLPEDEGKVAGTVYQVIGEALRAGVSEVRVGPTLAARLAAAIDREAGAAPPAAPARQGDAEPAVQPS